MPIQIPKGWKLVPIEPTEAMIKAGWEDGMCGFGEGEECEPVYKAMLEAAPEPPPSGTK